MRCTVTAFGGLIRRLLRKLSVIEWLVILAVIALLVAIIVPEKVWVASGSIQFPVRVLVFDASRGEPISGARVGIFWAPPLADLTSLETERDTYESKRRMRDGESATTDANGSAVIEYQFRTGGSNKRPAMHAHVDWTWVHVQAVGYGGVVIPVRHEFLPTKILREQKELVVPVGLTPVD